MNDVNKEREALEVQLRQLMARFDANQPHERHTKHEEALYWGNQWRSCAHEALGLANNALRKLDAALKGAPVAIPAAQAVPERSALAVLRAHAEARVHHVYNGLCPEEAGLHDSRDPECPVCAALVGIMPSASEAPAISLLAPNHRGMRVDYTGLLKQVRNVLRQCDEKYLHERVFQLGAHLKEMGQRWYAGDTAVVDEFLQLYCIEREARASIVRGTGDIKS